MCVIFGGIVKADPAFSCFLSYVLSFFPVVTRHLTPMKQPPRLDTTRKRIARGIKNRDAGALNHLHTELPRLRGRTTLAIVQFYNRVMPRSKRANEQAGKQCDRQTRTVPRRDATRDCAKDFSRHAMPRDREFLRTFASRSLGIAKKERKRPNRAQNSRHEFSSQSDLVLKIALSSSSDIIMVFLSASPRFEDKRKTILNTRTNFRSVFFFF